MIPKTIHQIWVGDNKIPRHIVDFMVEIKNVHKDYDYYLWTDGNLPKMPRKLKTIYNSLEHPAMKADLLRVYVLYLYGGIYLDADYKLISHLDALRCFNGKDAYIIYPKSHNIEDINNSILISSKNGSFISFMLKNIKTKKQWLGPHWYAECIFKYLNIESKTSYVKIIDGCVNNNIGFLDEQYVNGKVVQHEFLASWYPDSEWSKKFETGDYD